jgi:hypothetical protein
VVLSPAGDRALLTVHDDVKHVYAVYMGLFPTLEVQRIGLASPPIAAGVVAAAGRGYVAQKHPEGRITFVTLDSGEARTLPASSLARASGLDTTMNGSSRDRPLAALAAAAAGCGDRPAAWSQAPASTRPRPHQRGRVVDAPADRVVLLIPGTGQSLRTNPSRSGVTS